MDRPGILRALRLASTLRSKSSTRWAVSSDDGGARAALAQLARSTMNVPVATALARWHISVPPFARYRDHLLAPGERRSSRELSWRIACTSARTLMMNRWFELFSATL